MTSRTKVSERRRRRKRAKVGRKNAKVRSKAGTPKFPIIPQ